MLTSHPEPRGLRNRPVRGLFALICVLAASTASATTYISVEPVPNKDVVGEANLAAIRSIGFSNLERWSERLLNQCLVVDQVVEALSANGAISTVTTANTRFRVAAGGFEGSTNPSYVFTVRDSGIGSVNAADVDVLDNALGYVLNQGGTTHFSTDNARAYAFSLDYAVVTFSGSLTGDEARQFFDHLGTIDPLLWSGQFAGFTQIDFANASTNNSMLFLKPAVSKQRLISGLSMAVSDEPRATYWPLKNNGTGTTARAGVAFPGNDWLAFPDGDGYLANIGGSPQLLTELAVLRQRHLSAVASLLTAIGRGNVEAYLDHQFSCPS
jgi:hypothetical protein